MSKFPSWIQNFTMHCGIAFCVDNTFSAASEFDKDDIFKANII